jgi:ceramide glucosyltransferase
VAGWSISGLAWFGAVYSLAASVFTERFFRSAASRTSLQTCGAGVTILKPLHGAEPGLGRNLQGFFAQSDAGPLQIVCGVQDPHDRAAEVAQALIDACPEVDAALRVDPREHGENRKISNLINMMEDVSHPVLVLSDSDIGVGADYLRRVGEALSAPDVGVVTCPYFGRGETGFWSEIAGMGLSYHFLPNVIAGVALGMARPCMGSTIALTRNTLDRIGGFDAFRNVLADDYAIGAAVRALGLSSVMAPVLVSHSCVERSLGEVFAHELRWAKTVRGVDPAGHAGSIVTHALPLAVIAAALLGFAWPSLLLLAAAFGARVWLMRTVDKVIGRPLGAWWLIPARDMLSFLVFVGSFFVRSVEWRGMKFQVSADGDLKPV